MTISRQASAMIAPPEYASGFTHATVLAMLDDLSMPEISRQLTSIPPGELTSSTIASNPAFSAASMRRATLIAVI